TRTEPVTAAADRAAGLAQAAQPGKPAGRPGPAGADRPAARADPESGAQLRRLGQAHPGAAQPAIPIGIALQILLVFGLGVVERRCLDDLAADRPVAGSGQRLGIGVAAGQRGLQLRGVVAVDYRAVLGADVVALAHALRRVV